MFLFRISISRMQISIKSDIYACYFRGKQTNIKGNINLCHSYHQIQCMKAVWVYWGFLKILIIIMKKNVRAYFLKCVGFRPIKLIAFIVVTFQFLFKWQLNLFLALCALSYLNYFISYIYCTISSSKQIKNNYYYSVDSSTLQFEIFSLEEHNILNFVCFKAVVL